MKVLKQYLSSDLDLSISLINSKSKRMDETGGLL